jgi:hypothetical protein
MNKQRAIEHHPLLYINQSTFKQTANMQDLIAVKLNKVKIKHKKSRKKQKNQ